METVRLSHEQLILHANELLLRDNKAVVVAVLTKEGALKFAMDTDNTEGAHGPARFLMGVAKELKNTVLDIIPELKGEQF